MHFYCGCGRRISDTTDLLPYKACFLSNEDEIAYCDTLEQIIKDESLSLEERAYRAVVTLQVRYLSRCMYQCPDCGKKLSVFGESRVKETAAKYELPILSQLPIDPKLTEAIDAGAIEDFTFDYMDDAVAIIENMNPSASRHGG